MISQRDFIFLYINGRPVQVTGEDLFDSLSNFLRYQYQAVGTKIVCEEGDCGSCTVLLGRFEKGEISYTPVNSCIQYMYQLDCTHIITIEGLKQNGQLNPIQLAMMENHGAQCGFCTPGFVVAMCAMFDQQKPATPQDIRDALAGNLCRCTGYDPIIRSGMAVQTEGLLKLHQLYPNQAMIRDFEDYQTRPIWAEWDGKLFLNPVTLEDALKLKKEYPQAVIVNGGTDIHVLRNKRGYDPDVLLGLSLLPDLSNLSVENEVLCVGARVRLAQLETFVRELIPELYKILVVFGSPQIKQAGTLAGNIANGSPIGDTLPFLFVMNAEIELSSTKGVRHLPISAFYLGYKQFAMEADELITQIRIPLCKKHDILKLYKVSKRKHLDISSFTAAFHMTQTGTIIQSIKIAYGGVGPVIMRLPKTESFLQGKPFLVETFQQAGQVAQQEITPISDVRGSKDFRLQLAENILLKYYYDITNAETAVSV